jgi:hypothetical protein
MNNKVDLAAAWLMDLLQEHDMLESVIEFLGRKHPSHFSLSTLRRAYDKLGLVSNPVGSEKASLTDMLASVQARRIWDGATCVSEEDVAELRAELKGKNGRIRWMWGIPSDERIERSLTELEGFRAYHLAEAQRMADLIHKFNRARRKLDSQPATTVIDFDKPATAEPSTEPKPPAVPFVPSANSRF